MDFIVCMVGGIAGILIAFVIIAIYIHIKFKEMAKSYGYNSLKEVIKHSKNNVKSVSGLTTLLEPQIIRDYPEFNKQLIFSKVESNLLHIFNMLENKEVYNDFELQLVLPFLKEKIKDIKEQGIDYKYNDVVFHRHGIKSYERKDEIATIVVSSALEYYNDNEKDNCVDEKKQVRYITTFVYVYDVHKLKNDKPFFIMSCPNCGAPLKYLENMKCEYCGSKINEFNMKSWLITSFKEE